MRKTFAIFFVFIKVVLMQSVSAHESQPGSLEIKQVGQDRWDITWRAPIYYGKPHPAQLQLPEDWQTIGKPTQRRRSDAIIFHRVITTGGKSTDGRIIRLPGLETTITDVFVRLTRLDGSVMTTVARPTKPWAELRGERPWHATAGEYLGTGLHHILLITKDTKMIVAVSNAMAPVLAIPRESGRCRTSRRPHPASAQPAPPSKEQQHSARDDRHGGEHDGVAPPPGKLGHVPA